MISFLLHVNQQKTTHTLGIHCALENTIIIHISIHYSFSFVVVCGTESCSSVALKAFLMNSNGISVRRFIYVYILLKNPCRVCVSVCVCVYMCVCACEYERGRWRETVFVHIIN